MKKDRLIVEGLAGKKSLNGEVRINGAKNDVLKAMAASILFSTPLTIKDAPRTEDVKKMKDLLIGLGAQITESDSANGHDIVIDTSSVSSTSLDADLAKSMRASVGLTGPLLGRFGKVTFPIPGGCVIGARPIELFIAGYKKMGAEVNLESDAAGDRYVMSAPSGKPNGADIFFNMQTVGGTETLMMAAVLSKGKTILKNCAMEPEIAALAEFFNSCGANIKGAGTSTIEIVGGELLKASKPYVITPDRIEAGSFLILGALCADNLKLTHCNPAHVEATINFLRESGIEIHTTDTTIELKNNAKVQNSSLKPFNVRTHEYPGFPTDLQPQMSVYLTQVSHDETNSATGARGESIMFETIYEGRFKFVANLAKLGAPVTVMNPREIMIPGGSQLKSAGVGEELDAYDIRAGFAAIMMGLLATGTSVINNVYFIDRGYADIEGRLNAIGANVRRVHADEQPEIVI